MSGDRTRRFNRLAELRQRELDKEAAALARARAKEQDARAKLEEAEARAKEAVLARETLSKGPASASDWAAQEAWLAAQRKKAQRASDQRLECAREVEAARESVVKMRVRVRGLETLVERVEADEREAQAQADRRLEDEIAGQVVLSGPSSR
jgi:flagellar export protein FliJ